MSKFINNLKELRKDFNVSQDQLSKLIDAKKTSIVNIENKGAEPSIEILLKLSKFFDVSIDELIGNERESKNEFNTVSIFNKNIKDTINLNKTVPCWIRFKDNKTFEELDFMLYIQGKGEIEFYNPLESLNNENRIYLQFVNCLNGDYSKNFYSFFCTFGYLGKIKNGNSYTSKEIHLINDVFKNKKTLYSVPNMLLNMLDTNGIYYFTQPLNDLEHIINFILKELDEFEVNHNRFNIKGYYESFDDYVSYALEFKNILYLIFNNEYKSAFDIINSKMTDIILQNIIIENTIENSFIYNSLYGLMYMELLFDLQNNIIPVRCDNCNNNIFLTKNSSKKLCDECLSKGIKY